jgi:hypothetical protein
MNRLVYRIRYSLRLWLRIPKMTTFEAFLYPMGLDDERGDPIEDADEEISAMAW